MPEAEILKQAQEAEASGNLGEAERLVRNLLADEPNNAEARILLGMVSARQGAFGEAIQQFETILERDPTSAVALDRLVNVLRHVGRLDEAIAVAQRSIVAHPTDPNGFVNLGRCLLIVLRLPEAEACFDRAVKLDPNMGANWHHLGDARFRQGKTTEAIEAFRRAIQAHPTLVPTRVRLAQLLLTQGERKEAISLAEEAIKLEPDNAEAHVVLAEALQEEGRTQEAEAHIEKATSLDPKATIAQGFRLQVLGRFDQARTCFERALAAAPYEARAAYGLINGKKTAEADRPLIQQMLALAAEPRLPPPDRVALHFALGKAFDDLREFEPAMRHYREANGAALSFMRLNFDGPKLARINDERMKLYSRDLFASQSLTADRQSSIPNPQSSIPNPQSSIPNPQSSIVNRQSSIPDPVFVVGMIRSGTTLVEQALSRHPDIAPGGELRFWFEKEPEFNQALADGKLDQVRIDAYAAEYLDLLQKLAQGKPRVIDKMPLNFAYLGMIRLVFPEAPIIHCRRNPLDNCLSIYTTFFDPPPPFAHDPENIMFYYRQYERLMAHWGRLFAHGRFLEVKYEEMVASREATARKMVDFLGLEWNEAVLNHESNPRAVRTPSLWQVRQPIYSTSVERWRNFEPWLGEFAKLHP